MTLLKLHIMGARWYATVRDGNLTIGGLFGAPTTFSASMPRDAVLAEMRRLTQDLEIADDLR